MSADWDFHITLGGRQEVRWTARFLDAARALDMVPCLSRTTHDGMDAVLHASVEDLVEAWTREGGAFEIESPEHHAIVSSSGGAGFALGVRRSQLEGPDQAAAWAAVDHLVGAVLEIMPVTCVLGWEEDMAENLDRIGLLDLVAGLSEQIDGRIAVGELPAILGWLNIAPADSSLGRQLLAAADSMGMTPSRRGRYVELRLSARPWGAALQAVFDANRAWRASP